MSYLLVGETQDMVSVLLQKRGASLVIICLPNPAVNLAIKLHNQLIGQRNKIHDVASNGVLAAESNS